MALSEAGTHPTSSSSRVLDLAEKAIKAVGILAVLGYVSLRAHWNQLGIPVVTGVETERYIAEFYVLFTDLLLRLEVYAIFIGTVGLLGGFLWRRRSLAGVRARLALHLGKLEKRSSHHTAPAILLAALLSLLFWLLHAMTDLLAMSRGKPMAVGTLEPVAALRVMGNRLFDNLLVWVIVAAFACWLIPRVWNTGSSLVWTWHVCRAIVIILALHLPILYGSFVRDSRYPRVLWTADSGGSQCGLLILQTAENLSVWTADQGQGRIIVLPGKFEKTRLVLGEPKDLFETIDFAAKREADLKLCPAQVQSGR
jgi:hypothetical protein